MAKNRSVLYRDVVDRLRSGSYQREDNECPTSNSRTLTGTSRGLGEWDPGNVVGVDPHKHTVSATVLDTRGGVLAIEHFRISGEGHRALEAWALAFGPIAQWAVGALRAGDGTPRRS